ncbi:MAG: hypothetical protein IJ820_02970, partial [Lachnospiraceae bacterium]|nr:hypothetical protein [Lachnospiraceae bacterium]
FQTVIICPCCPSVLSGDRMHWKPQNRKQAQQRRQGDTATRSGQTQQNPQSEQQSNRIQIK